ncbi:MAG: tetratricopeptide repeat protein [Chloroflexota bacterium]|jgi:tetratricopeptide (TPR) repeat protein
MATFPEERLRAKRQLSERAIALAMASRWEEAAQVNRELLNLFPEDVDAHNRMGKALTELGKYEEAKAAYSRAAALDPTNVIAMKNLQRLSRLAPEENLAGAPTRVDPALFIEESGKTVITSLVNTAGLDVLAKMDAGDLLEIRYSDRAVELFTPQGENVGKIEPKLAKRLKSLLEGGNRYQAAVTSVDDQTVKVIIREIYKSPAMAGKVSFPSKAPAEVFRGYIKNSVLKYDLDDEEDLMEEAEEGIEPTAEAELGIEEPEIMEESELPEE